MDHFITSCQLTIYDPNTSGQIVDSSTHRHWYARNPTTVQYGYVIMSAIASQITSLTIVYSTVYSDADQRKHQSSASLAFVRWIHRRPVNSPHKWPVTRKMFQFDDVIIRDLTDAVYWSGWEAVLLNKGLFREKVDYDTPRDWK